MRKPTAIAAVTLSTLVLAGGVGVGIAAADPTPSPAPSTSAPASPNASPTAKASKAAKKHRDLTRRALHGEVTLAGKQHRVVDFQRGTVGAVSATSLTVTSKDGFEASYAVVPTTKVRKDKKPAAVGDVKTGDRVRVVAVKDGSTLQLKRVGDAGPK
jgi:hypothetical protein